MKKEDKTKISKSRIIEAAIMEFGTNGYQGASLNSVCASGISKGLLYHNFENKDALYLSCMERCFHEIVEYFQAQELENSLECYMDKRQHFFNAHPYHARMFMECISQPPLHLLPALQEIQKGFNEMNQQFIVSMLDSLPLRNSITKEDAYQYFLFIQSMFNNSFATPQVQHANVDNPMLLHEQSLPKLLDFMLYGIVERS